MKLLLIGDRECPAIWDYYRPGMLRDYGLILSAGDLKADYLSFLVTMGRAPLLYVHGNHDGHYEKYPPEGCDCVEDRVLETCGLKIAGLGGSVCYNKGPHQFTEGQMARRVRRLERKIKKAGGVDIILAHSPAAGLGDMPDPAHRGFECFLGLIDRWQPRYFIHSHVHMNYSRNISRELKRDNTAIINAYERYEIEV